MVRVRVQAAGFRATVYREGGVGYDRHVPGIGWVVCDDDSDVPAVLDDLVEAVETLMVARHGWPGKPYAGGLGEGRECPSWDAGR